jgi:hypothetical protein
MVMRTIHIPHNPLILLLNKPHPPPLIRHKVPNPTPVIVQRHNDAPTPIVHLLDMHSGVM